MLDIMILNIRDLSVTLCITIKRHYDEYYYRKYHIIDVLTVFMLNVVMLSIMMPESFKLILPQSEEEKVFNETFFSSLHTKESNKLKCLYLASFFSLV
jgi:hypothetical protein